MEKIIKDWYELFNSMAHKPVDRFGFFYEGDTPSDKPRGSANDIGGHANR